MRCEKHSRTECASCEDDPLIQYRETVAPQPHVSVAESLIAYWERPWSTTALRFAYHALERARRAGIDVLEHTPRTH